MSREWTTPIVEVPVPEGERKAKAKLQEFKQSLLRNGGNLVPIAPEAMEKLTEDWSEPLEAEIEDGELVFRIVP